MTILPSQFHVNFIYYSSNRFVLVTFSGRASHHARSGKVRTYLLKKLPPSSPMYLRPEKLVSCEYCHNTEVSSGCTWWLGWRDSAVVSMSNFSISFTFILPGLYTLNVGPTRCCIRCDVQIILLVIYYLDTFVVPLRFSSHKYAWHAK